MDLKMTYSIDLEKISDKEIKAFVIHLINSLEESIQANREQQQQLQALKDEINRLKGEQGKPGIMAGKKKLLK